MELIGAMLLGVLVVAGVAMMPGFVWVVVQTCKHMFDDENGGI